MKSILILLTCLICTGSGAEAGLFRKTEQSSVARSSAKEKKTKVRARTYHKASPAKVASPVASPSRASRAATSVRELGHELRESIRQLCVRTTAYCHEEADHKPYGRLTAIGTTLQCRPDHTSAAADWSRFPLGTRFQIVGEPTIYVVEDCGGALWGTSTIDIYRPTMSAMHAWGTRHVEIKILQYGTAKH